MIALGAAVQRALLSGLLGVALLGCGEAAPGGAPAATPNAVTTSSTAASTASVPVATAASSAPATFVPSATTATTPHPTPSAAAPPASDGVARPNPRLTPGEVFPNVTVGQMCTPGYSSGVRHVEHQQYVEVYAAYGVPYPEPSGSYELDHLIPLELGGDNSDVNLDVGRSAHIDFLAGSNGHAGEAVE